MKHTFILLFCFFSVISGLKAADTFVPEREFKQGLLQMLATFTTYMKADYQPIDERMGCFQGENTRGSDERGVRPNADMSMVCAFLSKYAQYKVTLPAGVSWKDVDEMAMKSLVFAYSTHKANHLVACRDGQYWGSTSKLDHQWESSLWAMSVAYSAYFQWERLDQQQRSYIRDLLRAECNYELERTVPTGFRGDTKAEENGWEACVLAATIGLFPTDELAPRWYNRLQEFAVNSYSHPSDTSALYLGPNLFPDWTLQNHFFFHTSYQNVVIQELGEAALALQLFQGGMAENQRWNRGELLHNCSNVTRNVLNWLSLPDGEQAMPNGNDWSLFLYDQITSYSTMACMLGDADALMLENRAFGQIRHRQTTTSDGSWLLRPDVGGRRMGVEAHRVMMSWLMHEYFSTAEMKPSTWTEFLARHAEARVFPDQNIVRAASKDRFTCFSWSIGKQSYTGYVALNNPTNNNLIVPYRYGNTGSFIGYYTVEGAKTNALPVVSGNYQLKGNSYVMNGELNVNDSALNQRFVIWSTPGNAVIYMDDVCANRDAQITAERGGLMAISTDEFTRIHRDFHTSSGELTLDGKNTHVFTSAQSWINVDRTLGVLGTKGKKMAFGECDNNNSILTSKLYAFYDDAPRNVKRCEVVDHRHMILYSNIDNDETARFSAKMIDFGSRLPQGWSGLMAFDPDSVGRLVVSNFRSDVQKVTFTIDSTPLGFPILNAPTRISANQATVTIHATMNNSYTCDVQAYIRGKELEAMMDPSGKVRVTNNSRHSQTVNIILVGQQPKRLTKKLKVGQTVVI